MSKPYRIIVWGPSNLGNACIREILRLPDFELIGVLGYSAHKNGKDIGALLGLPDCGVRVTTNKEAMFALPADCVIYTSAPPFDRDTMERDVIRLLESGKNVVSATAFFYAPFHGRAYVDTFEAACRKGGTSLHGTGENGGFMLERLATTLSALTNTVERVKLQESVYVGNIPAPTLAQYGFGVDPAEALSGPVNTIFKRWMFVESVTFACVALFGRTPERVEHNPIYEPSREDVAAESITIHKGKTRFVRHMFNAILDGKPRVTIELLWYVRHEDAPFRDEGGSDKWKIEIEGKPTSLKMTLEAVASIDRNLELHPGDPTIPSYYATASVLLQAVPVVVAAPPGIVYATTFTNSVEDFHRLATRKSLVE
jgi:2,4-diaminopentanoate dehydrogenase